MIKLFNFGEIVDSYNYKVINEREARASAGIMFLLGIVSFFHFILTKNIFYAELFSITFILEFFIRIFINPLYAPYMIIGSWFVKKQKPEWVEANPKKFAWVLGLILGLIMGYFVLFNILTPIRLIVCLICLVLLYLEAVFGICLGCIVYKRLNFKLQNCAGGVCENRWQKPKRVNPIISAISITLLFGGIYYTLKNSNNSQTNAKATINKIEKKDCTPPQWAINIGHKDIWLKHHGCK